MKENNVFRSILIAGIGLFLFIAPIKFGLPIGRYTSFLYKDIFEWLISPWPNDILCIGIIVLFTLWFIWSASNGKIRIRYSFLDVVIFIFLFTAVASAFRAPNKYRAYICVTQYLCYALVYFLVFNMLDTKKDLRFIFNMLFIPAILISLYAVYQYYVGLPATRAIVGQYIGQQSLSVIKDRLASNRVFATFVYPNTLTGYLLLCIPLAAGFFSLKSGQVVQEKKKKILGIVVVLIMTYALCLTFYEWRGITSKLGNTLMYRWENWSAGFKIIKKYPVFGIGPGNFGSLYPQYRLDIAEEIKNAHNNFLQIWAEQGIFGFLSFCLIWIIAIVKGLGIGRSDNNNDNFLNQGVCRWLLAGLILFAIHNLLDFDWYIPGLTIVAFAFIGIVIRMGGCYREEFIVIKKRWARKICIYTALFSSFFILFCLGRNIVERYYIEGAKEYYNNKNLYHAEEFCKKAIGFDGPVVNNPYPYFLMAQICSVKKDFSGSISFYKEAIQNDPYSSLYYYYLAVAYLNQVKESDPSQRIELFNLAGSAIRKAVEFYPTKPFYRYQLAQFYEGTGHPVSAVREYMYCLELNDKIENECRISSKNLNHLILGPDIVNDIKKRIDSAT